MYVSFIFRGYNNFQQLKLDQRRSTERTREQELGNRERYLEEEVDAAKRVLTLYDVRLRNGVYHF